MHHVRILENQIVWETEKAYLVKVPKSKKWKFWVSKKLLQRNKKSYMMALWDDMKIKLISDAGNEKMIDVYDLMELFGFNWDNSVIDDLLDEEV